jgi:hypothetical protein
MGKIKDLSVFERGMVVPYALWWYRTGYGGTVHGMVVPYAVWWYRTRYCGTVRAIVVLYALWCAPV